LVPTENKKPTDILYEAEIDPTTLGVQHTIEYQSGVSGTGETSSTRTSPLEKKHLSKSVQKGR